MGSSESNTRRYTSLILGIILLFTIIGTCFLFFEFIDSKTKLNELQKELIQVTNSVEVQNNEITTLNNEIMKYKEIEKNIEDIKCTYFNNAEIADSLARENKADFRVCYLTFDDGPYLLTDEYLDVLKDKDVLATFFLRKREEDDYKHIYKRYKNEGHTLGNHTATHTIRYVYRDEDTFISDLQENREFIYGMLGITTDVMRFPGGSKEVEYMDLDFDSMISRLNEINYEYVDWNCATGDGLETVSPDDYLKNVIDGSKDQNVIVVLMHDYSYYTIQFLPDIIDELRNEGFIFLPLWKDCPEVKHS